MEERTEQSFWGQLENIIKNLKSQRLADVFRFISFQPGETYGPHEHLRIEINYVKKGSCTLRLDSEDVSFREGEIMIITSHVNHIFVAGTEGTTLMQLEFLPEIFCHFNPGEGNRSEILTPDLLFSEENHLIKIINNIGIMRVVQRIINELESQDPHYQYMVVMHYAELLILIYRHMNEAYLPICTNEFLKKATAFIRLNYQSDLSVTDIAQHSGISERYLRQLFARHLNLSPLGFLNQTRIHKSVTLLRNTEMSVKEVCFTCGFRSPQYFSRVFKQQTGFPPHKITDR